ncbi:NTP transferase domain-containing protein [Phycicoccus sp. Soil748]|uniref:nucleotidyltransferase family protein n=1 Tax=Intrasporangiaceae TaxID=85021 RepID=UPI000AE9685A|nr:nucleotidyltransferase family protein [Phycicoccus sp. Soil748]
MPPSEEQLRGMAGLLLAAGGGRRMGRPKAMLDDPSGGSFVERGLQVLRESGCDPVVVVLGAGAAQVRPLVTAADTVVEAADWAQGQSTSLRAGLEAVAAGPADAVVVLLVDLPDVGADVVRRVREATAGEGPAALGRAAYGGAPGHPVVLGRDHWAGVLDLLAGDRGARDYLAAHPHTVVECGDLATGADADTPADLS